MKSTKQLSLALLDKLEDMVQRLEALEQGLPLPQAETPELAAAAVEDPVESEEAGPDELALGEEAAASSRPAGRPDLPVLFGDYAWFAVGAPGEPGYEIAIGRCFGDVFFDLHRFTAPGEEESWGLREAIGEFLRAKIRANFVPQNLNHESLPEDSEEPSSLPLDLVESIYDTID